MKSKIDQHNSITDHMKARKGPEMESTLKHFDNELVETALKLINVAKMHNDPASAEKIREMTFLVVTDTRLKAP